MVNQVPIVAGLLIAQGILETLMGLFFVGVGIVMKVVPQFNKTGGGEPFDFSTFGLLLYGGGGVLNLAAGILNITAGVKNVKYRGRILGIVALISGVVTIFPCYCFPT